MRNQENIRRRYYTHLSIVLFLVIATFVYLLSYSEVRRVPIAKPLNTFPYHLGYWRGTSGSFTSEVLDLLSVDDYMLRRYSNGDGPRVTVYVGYYEKQSEFDKIHSPKNCLPGAGWYPVSSSTEEIRLNSETTRTFEVKKYLVQKGLEKELILYWYMSRGRVVTDEYEDRFYLIWDSILKKRTDGAMVRVTSRVNSNVDRTWEHLSGFLEEFFPVLEEYIPR